MKITVHRPNQIGGCITEIESKVKRLTGGKSVEI